MSQQTARLVIEFADEEKLADFLDDMRYHEVLPKDCGAYHMDGLDRLTENRTYILRRFGSRPEEMRLVITKTETETKKA